MKTQRGKHEETNLKERNRNETFYVTTIVSRSAFSHWKRPWCWERLRAGGEAEDRGWDGWMASPTQWTWVWVSSGSWWWTGKPGVLQSMGSQRAGHDWATELNWTELSFLNKDCLCPRGYSEVIPARSVFPSVFRSLSLSEACTLISGQYPHKP